MQLTIESVKVISIISTLVPIQTQLRFDHIPKHDPFPIIFTCVQAKAIALAASYYAGYAS
jgi:hypothetical protein